MVPHQHLLSFITHGPHQHLLLSTTHDSSLTSPLIHHPWPIVKIYSCPSLIYPLILLTDQYVTLYLSYSSCISCKSPCSATTAIWSSTCLFHILSSPQTSHLLHVYFLHWNPWGASPLSFLCWVAQSPWWSPMLLYSHSSQGPSLEELTTANHDGYHQSWCNFGIQQSVRHDTSIWQVGNKNLSSTAVQVVTKKPTAIIQDDDVRIDINGMDDSKLLGRIQTSPMNCPPPLDETMPVTQLWVKLGKAVQVTMSSKSYLESATPHCSLIIIVVTAMADTSLWGICEVCICYYTNVYLIVHCVSLCNIIYNMFFSQQLFVHTPITCLFQFQSHKLYCLHIDYRFLVTCLRASPSTM